VPVITEVGRSGKKRVQRISCLGPSTSFPGKSGAELVRIRHQTDHWRSNFPAVEQPSFPVKLQHQTFISLNIYHLLVMSGEKRPPSGQKSCIEFEGVSLSLSRNFEDRRTDTPSFLQSILSIPRRILRFHVGCFPTKYDPAQHT
jgi:hypothetical protein